MVVLWFIRVRIGFYRLEPNGKIMLPPKKTRHHNQKQRLSGATFNKGTPRSSANQRRNAGDEAVQNQWFYSKCAAAANDALIFPASPPDERRVHFIDWQRKVRVGERPPPGLRRWSDISCEEIKTRHLNGANGERGPSCTIGRRRRKKKKTEGALSETRVTEGSSLTFCLSFSSFPTWFILRSTCGRQLKGSFTKTIISHFPQIFFFFFFLIVRSRDYQSNRYFNKLVYFSLFFFANRVFHSVCSQRNINPAENRSYLQPLHFINHPSEHINVIYDRRIIYR